MYRKVKIDIENAYVPVVKYVLGNRAHWAIIDTGARFSILDTSLGAGIENGHEMNLVTLSKDGGQTVRRAEKSITFVDVDNKKFNCDITGYETALWHMEDALKGVNKHKIKVDMIIGNNDLCAYRCKVDLKNGYLLIQDKRDE